MWEMVKGGGKFDRASGPVRSSCLKRTLRFLSWKRRCTSERLVTERAIVALEGRER